MLAQSPVCCTSIIISHFYFIKMKIIFSFLICFLCIKQLYGQKYIPTNGVLILGGDKSKLYVDNTHSLIISSEKDFINNFIVSASQGNLERYDTLKKLVRNLMFLLSDLKSGKVTISVLKKSDTGLQVLNKRTFRVVNKLLTKGEQNTLKAKVKPEVTLAGYKSDSIPFNILKTATQLTVNKPYKLLSAIIICDNVRDSHPSITLLNSEEFSEDFKTSLSKIKFHKDIIIGFDEIIVVDQYSKKYFVKPMWFRLTKN